jgi:hypothetical protein
VLFRSAADDQLFEAILSYLESVEAGTPIDHTVLLAIHPDLAADLQDFIHAFARLENLMAPVRQFVHSLIPRSADSNGTLPS